MLLSAFFCYILVSSDFQLVFRWFSATVILAIFFVFAHFHLLYFFLIMLPYYAPFSFVLLISAFFCSFLFLFWFFCNRFTSFCPFQLIYALLSFFWTSLLFFSCFQRIPAVQIQLALTVSASSAALSRSGSATNIRPAFSQEVTSLVRLFWRSVLKLQVLMCRTRPFVINLDTKRRF